MDIVGLGKPRADSCLRKFRTRGGVALVKTLLYKGPLFLEAPQDHILASYQQVEELRGATWPD
jgi:hypothetical protein